MMVADFLDVKSVILNLKATTKKQALQDVAQIVAERTQVEARAIFETLLHRERLGSTGVGDGIAVPHGKLTELDRLHGFFIRLEKPVDFDAPDGAPVSLLFVLLAPEGAGADHLKALACIARVMRDEVTVNSIRQSEDPDAIYTLLTSQTASHAA